MNETTDPQAELSLLVRSRHPIIHLQTMEEERAEQLVRDIAGELSLPLFSWSVTRGVVNLANDEAIPRTQQPADALAAIDGAGIEAIYLLKDLSRHVEDATVVRYLRDMAPRFTIDRRSLLLMASGPVDWPAGLDRWVATFRLRLPGRDQIDRLVRDCVTRLSREQGVRASITRQAYQQLINALRGLTGYEARLALNRALLDDKLLDESDVPRLMEAKRELIQRKGLLEFIPPEIPLDQIGGLARLKQWLEQRRSGFSDQGRDFGLTPPRGVFLLGVQGCGKSMACKAVGSAWGVPILRLDPGRLYSKYIGESEQRFAQACELAEAMSPCVLWIDEIEKAFASAGSSESDGGLSRRIFGSLLGWLQDHPEGIFVAATANDIASLPPELMRKGRFDEIFFVDLPTPAEREEVFAIHLRRRERDPAGFDLPMLAAEADGFSGAEIEQAVLAALYAAFSNGGKLTTELLAEELRSTYPLSVTQAERIDQLRHWAMGRCVPAGGEC
jgi:AAA+ superfamily predicted ATPase